MKRIGKTICRRFPKRKQAQAHLIEDIEAGRAPFGNRSAHLDTTALFLDNDQREELTMYNKSLFKVKEEDIETRRSHKRGSGSPTHRNRSKTSEQVQANRMSDSIAKVDGIPSAADNGKDKGRIISDSFRDRQSAVTRIIRHLDCSRQSERVGRAAQGELKAFDRVDRFEEAVEAKKEHGVDQQHLAWISKLLEQRTLQMRLRHFTTRKFETTRGLPQGAPEARWCSLSWLTQY